MDDIRGKADALVEVRLAVRLGGNENVSLCKDGSVVDDCCGVSTRHTGSFPIVSDNLETICSSDSKTFSVVVVVSMGISGIGSMPEDNAC